MITNAQKQKAKLFQNLHHKKELFIIPNIWDTGSAYIFSKAGFPALATSSAGIAYALGKADGEKIAFDELLYTVKKITAVTEIPVSVDFEKGYAENIVELKHNAKLLFACGAVGVNIEDGQPETNTLTELNAQIKKIVALKELQTELELPFVLNARTCVYWLNLGSEEEKFQTACQRGKAFALAGADCVFVPGSIANEKVAQLVKNIPVPLNTILNSNNANLQLLKQAGVRRLSLGSAPARYLCQQAINMAAALSQGDFAALLANKFTYAKANKYFQGF